MNEELTDEVLEAMKKCGSSDCAVCDAYNYCNGTSRDIVIEALATALLEERAKPKVWDGAPEDTIQAQITWVTKNGDYIGIKKYFRELPKTRTRIMAEEVTALVNRAIDGISIDEIETLLTKYVEELENEGEV